MWRVPRLCCRARPTTHGSRRVAGSKEDGELERPGEETCWAESQRGKDGAEARRVFVLVRELHAAAVTVGGERSWSSAAVNRSMTLIGAPHLGQYREGGEFVALETCGSACRRWVAPRR
jgi:hypothetical protein